ncbi:Hypothetical predicted protein, partial [Paramuricea clavata]
RTPMELRGNSGGTTREALKTQREPLQNPEKNPTESQRINLTSTREYFILSSGDKPHAQRSPQK